MWWIFLSAWAQSPCEPTPPEALEQTIEEAKAALHDGDRVRVASLHSQVVHQIPCLDGVPEPAIWAEHLQSVAVLMWARGEDWQAPMRSALRVNPSLVRPVGPTHPISAYQSPPEGEWTDTPPGVQVYLDGQEVSALPVHAGTHLLQVRGNDVLRSQWLTSQAPSESSLLPNGSPAVPDAPARTRSRRGMGRVGMALAITGSVAATSTWAAAKARPRIGRQGDDALVVTNVSGWTLAGAGVGVWALSWRK